MKHLKKLRKETTSADWVFPSRFQNKTHRKTVARATERLRKSLGSSLDHFTAHDLRRTVGTELSKLGIDDVVIAKILGHTQHDNSRKVTSVYNRWEKLERWASKLEQVTTDVPAKVGKSR